MFQRKSSQDKAARTKNRETVWRSFCDDKELLSRHQVTREEIRTLSRVALFGSIKSEKDFVFILEQIRRAASQSPTGADSPAASAPPALLIPKSSTTVLKMEIVGESVESRDSLKSALAGISEFNLIIRERLLARGTVFRVVEPDVVMLIVGRDVELALEELRARKHSFRPPIVVAVLPHHSPELMKQALRAGADDLLFMPLDAGHITKALLKLHDALKNFSRRDGGKVVTVASMTGGAGVTSVCAGMAQALHHEQGMRVAVVDLDLQNATLTAMLGVSGGPTIADLIDSAPMTPKTPDAVLQRHSSGIRVLASPGTITDLVPLSEETLGSALDMMRQMFDLIVVDCGSHISDVAVTAWERSDKLLYVSDQSYKSASNALRFWRLWRRLAIASVDTSLILNRFDPRFPVSEKLVADTLDHPVFATLPRDDAAMMPADASQLQVPLPGRDSTFAAAVERMCGDLFSNKDTRAVAGHVEKHLMEKLNTIRTENMKILKTEAASLSD